MESSCKQQRRGIALSSFVAFAALLTSPSAGAQNAAAPASDEGTFTGVVVSSTRSTLVVRGGERHFRLFVLNRNTAKPATLPVGSQVRVTSTPGDEPDVHVATEVTILQAAPAGQGGASSSVIPPEVRRTERDIQRQARRYQLGVRAGVALDPELVLLGVHSQVGPFFNSDVFLRPSVEFAYGEVTALFALNLEAIYRLPISSRHGRWSAYVGLGPGFNFVHQNFERSTGQGSRIDFGEFQSDTGLNILGGLRYRSGMFTELKTSVYSDPAPTLRLIIGYNF
jgi:hypothetical protein